jgi:Major Facilitator Superfamily
VSNFRAVAAIPIYTVCGLWVRPGPLESLRYEGPRIYPPVREPHRRALHPSHVRPGDLPDAARGNPAAEDLVPPRVECREWPAVDSGAAAHDVCQISALWNVVLSAIGVASVLLGGKLSNLLEAEGGDRAFHILFLVCAAVVAGVVVYGWWRPSVVFDNVRAERQGRNHPIDDLRRLAKHWPVYPALLIMLLWNFAPGTDTPLLFYLQRTFHATNTQWGEWNAIFSASFIPTFALFGVLCTRVPLRQLLVWGTIIGVPQMIPLLFIDSVGDALIAAVAMGLMGGVASGAYVALVIRSCPPALQGTVLMMSAALEVAAARLGDILGTRLYDNFGGFQACVIAITIVYALILPTVLLIPRKLISTADGEI